jgi:iron(III) transport system ATP-binding protein
MGPSGSGKSTFMNVIGCLDKPTSGTYRLDGEQVSTLTADALAAVRNRKIGFVFQQVHLLDRLDALANVELPMIYAETDRAGRKDKAVTALQRVGLGERIHHRPTQLSGGQQQRVAVARAVVLQPSVLLFDEPLSNLDAKLRRRVREEIRELQQQLALTAVYVTHDQEEALAVSDRIIVMRNAEIAQIGTPHQLYEEPVDAFVADFIGDANLLQGEITALEGDLAIVDIAGSRHRLPHRGLKPGNVQIAVRPESIQLARQQVNGAIPARVKKATYLGNHNEYSIDCVLGSLFVNDHHLNEPITAGSEEKFILSEHWVT